MQHWLIQQTLQYIIKDYPSIIKHSNKLETTDITKLNEEFTNFIRKRKFSTSNKSS